MPEFGLLRVTTADRRRNYFIVMDHTDSNSGAPGAQPGTGDLPLTVLGDYTLLREIGRGGMGVVYEARQASLDRSVAVKVLGQQVSASPKAVLRFRREAQAAAKLHHANIVPIFGLGETDGIYYYAMEFIDGCGLNAIIKPETPSVPSATTDIDPAETVLLERSGGPAASAVSSSSASTSSSGASSAGEPKGSRVEVRSRKKHYEMVATHIASIADALDYAHGEGVVHRDIKPHNLIMGKDGKLRIADFGLARLAEQPGVTVTGEMIGSPLYMSPEQITAASSEVDHRTDIYSLGATLYEWLTGCPPYPGETRERVISRILTTEPLTLRAHNEDIPLDLETVCLKAIDRDPQRRYQTGGALRDDLQRFVENRPIRAKRASLPTRLRKFVGRHQLASLGAVAAVVAVSLAAALFDSKRDTQTQAAVATKAQDENDKILDAFSSLGLTDGLAGLLPVELSAPFRMAQAALPMLQSVVDPTSGTSAGVPAADAASASTPAGVARRAARDFYVATTGPEAWISLGEGSSACSAVVGQIDELWRMDGDAAMTLVEACLASRPDFMAISELRAAMCGWFGKPQRMKAAAEELAQRHPDAPRVHAWRGLARTLAGGGEAGLADLTKAMEADPTSVWPQALNGLAMTWMRRSFEAISRFDEALETDPDLIVALLGRALARADLGNYSGAVSDLGRVLDAEPENVNALVSRGDQEVNNGDFEAAVRDYDQAIVVGGRTPALSLRSLLARTRLRDAAKGDSPQPGMPQRLDAEAQPSQTGDAAWDQRRLKADPLKANAVDSKRGSGLRPFSVRWGGRR